jgi:hypothetical protein
MPGNPREMITSAERRFPVRIRIALPPNGLGPTAYPNHRLARRELRRGRVGHDTVENARVLNDALSIYFADATLASAFVARWCVGAKVETAGGGFQARKEESEAPVGAGLHRTP